MKSHHATTAQPTIVFECMKCHNDCVCDSEILNSPLLLCLQNTRNFQDFDCQVSAALRVVVMPLSEWEGAYGPPTRTPDPICLFALHLIIAPQRRKQDFTTHHMISWSTLSTWGGESICRTPLSPTRCPFPAHWVKRAPSCSDARHRCSGASVSPLRPGW